MTIMRTPESGTVLVTGGAGYIGSHVVKQLEAAGESVVVLDNLSTGFRQALPRSRLVVGDVGDIGLVKAVIEENDVTSIMHFAASTVVPESVADPLKYYRNNSGNTRRLLEVAVSAGIDHFIFSSTAAVYGIPRDGVASEDSATRPINPYGHSKLMSEQMLRDVSAAGKVNYVALRYFNVAGSDFDLEIGQSTRNATLLVKVACEAALGIRDSLTIYGCDYDTPDGTGVRDYIHVVDLAAAHVDALIYLRQGGESTTLNCGYGAGYSVREVIGSVETCAGIALNVMEAERRPGDPPTLVAKADRIGTVLGWSPSHNSLEEIVRSSLDWESKQMRNPWSNSAGHRLEDPD